MASIQSTAAGMDSRMWVPDKEEVWVVAKLSGVDDETRVVYCELVDGTKVTFPASAVHPVDSSHLRDLSDVCLMNNLHEAPLLELLRRRLLQDQMYTFASNVLISVNPYVSIQGLYDSPLAFLDFRETLAATRNHRAVIVAASSTGATAVASLADGDFVAEAASAETQLKRVPHVFDTANQVYQELVTNVVSSWDGEALRRRSSLATVQAPAAPSKDASSPATLNQSIVISGESGAGKTENCKHVISFLIHANKQIRQNSGCAAGQDGTEKLNSVLVHSSVVLEAFGNAKTLRNDNSSRFGKYVKVQYGHDAGERDSVPGLFSAHTETFLLEKSRLVNVGKGERNYHIFYQLLQGLRSSNLSLSCELGLASATDPGKPCRFTMLQGTDTTASDKEGEIIFNAHDAADFPLTKEALRTLNCSELEIESIWRLLAAILHIGNLVFCETEQPAVNAAAGEVNKPQPVSIDCPSMPLDKLAALIGLDNSNQLTTALATQMVKAGNRSSISTKLLTVDGARHNAGALMKWTYNRLFAWLVGKINQAQGNVQEQSTAVTFIGILDIFGFEILRNNSFEQLCINLANERLQQQFNEQIFVMEQEIYRSENLQWSDIRFNSNDFIIGLISSSKSPFGLLLLLEEHSKLNRKSDDSMLLASFNQTHETPPAGSRRAYSRGRFGQEGFTVHHFAGDVNYAVVGFLEKNNDSLQEDLMGLLACSSSSFIRNAILVDALDQGPGYIHSLVAEASTGAKKQSTTVSAHFRKQLEELMATLRSTTPHYIKCIKSNSLQKSKLVEAVMVMEQLKYSGVLEVVRIRREGYPVRVPFNEFFEDFEMLFIFACGARNTEACAALAQIPHNFARRGCAQGCDAALAKLCCEAIASFGLQEQGAYQVGASLIFLRDGGLATLQAITRRLIGERAVVIQALVRSKLGKSRYKRTQQSCLLLQSRLRTFAARRRYKVLHQANTVIRSRVLTYILRNRFLVELDAIRREQKIFKQQKRSSAIKVQKEARKFIARKQHRKELTNQSALARISQCVLRFRRNKALLVRLTALHAAATQHNGASKGVIDALLAVHPADLHLRSKWAGGRTLYQSAIVGGNADLVRHCSSHVASLPLPPPPGAQSVVDVLDSAPSLCQTLLTRGCGGACSAHFLSMHPSLPILRLIVAGLDAYAYEPKIDPNLVIVDEDDARVQGKGDRSSQEGDELAGQTIIKEGWLKKVGGWVLTKRWGVLTDDFLLYYKDERKAGGPRMSIPLHGTKISRLVGTKEPTFEITHERIAERKGFFGVKSAKSFALSDEQELQAWLLPLRAVAGVQSFRDSAVTYCNVKAREVWAGSLDSQGNSPLHLLVQSCLAQCTTGPPDEAFVWLAAWLAEHGADVNQQNKQGKSPIDLALGGEAFDAFAATLCTNADASAQQQKQELLSIADSRIFHKDLVACLLNKGGNSAGKTVLAAFKQAVVQMDKGALNALRHQHMVELLRLLMQFSAGPIPAVLAAEAFLPISAVHRMTGYSYLSLFFAQGSFPTWSALRSEDAPFAIEVSVRNAADQDLERTCVSHRQLLDNLPRAGGSGGRDAADQLQRMALSGPSYSSRRDDGLFWGTYWHMKTPLENVLPGSYVLVKIVGGRGGGDGQAQSCWGLLELDTALLNSGPAKVVLHAFPAPTVKSEMTSGDVADDHLEVDIVLSKSSRAFDYKLVMSS
mmetsp:Transcript_17676/g.39962  ORF Transcript_17676/g.39962 Transcript_17676/m.39962 type:complete len:1692 (+) Transcript_17676:116-5191(+)